MMFCVKRQEDERGYDEDVLGCIPGVHVFGEA